ncbi:MAG: aminoacyl-tRNA hydrolase [candidate division Zixibacteria bacterium]|nr:aminoacyl-tRNA hydrolase [candidate division Zixibacteria bacterium]
MFVFVGLGNPGTKYALTRHNAGFRVIDALLGISHARLASVCDVFHAVEVSIEREPVVLVKPTTYMNRSGRAVAEACRRYGVSPDRLVVIYDEVHIDFGVLRMRGQGSHGGHNGVASIIATLSTQTFVRQRIGIGPPPNSAEMIDYVLGTFTIEEEDRLPKIIDRACAQLRMVVTEGWAAAASRYNGAIGL